MPQMRAFHMSWMAFFLCFFAWFGIAPLMAIVRDEFGLTKSQIGNTIIASVLVTTFARIIIGSLCDRFGPRLTYSWLLVLGSIPVMCIGFAHDYVTFLLFRLAIGVIGASFVITQFHTSVMFAPNIVGTANATTAGWGNLGAGASQLLMPLVFGGFVLLGFSDAFSWRASMFLAGLVCMGTGLAYYRFTQDTPEGNYEEVTSVDASAQNVKKGSTFFEAAKDNRVWYLFMAYAACFGVELTINNIAALYFMDYFGLGLMAAGAFAACFGLMNIFARTVGGVVGDRVGRSRGLRGRAMWLTVALAAEGVSLIVFSQMTGLALAMVTMIIFSIFVKMAQGATFSVVPFINKRALGSIAGIVGAGGNFGAVGAGFLLKSETLTWPSALLILGLLVLVCAGLTAFMRFSESDEKAARQEMEERLQAIVATDEVPEAA